MQDVVYLVRERAAGAWDGSITYVLPCLRGELASSAGGQAERGEHLQTK